MACQPILSSPARAPRLHSASHLAFMFRRRCLSVTANEKQKHSRVSVSPERSSIDPTMANNRTIKSHRRQKYSVNSPPPRPSSTVRVTAALRACNVRPRAVITKAQSRPTFNRAAKLYRHIYEQQFIPNIINISDNNRDYTFFFSSFRFGHIGQLNC